MDHSQDDLLLMALQLNSITLSDEIDAYLYPNGVLLPFGAVCQALGIGITVNPEDGTASGFVVDEKRRFHLDAIKGEAVIADHLTPFEPSMVELHRNDIYVDSKLIERWLPVTLTVDKNASMVGVHPREPLPIQLRMDRERRLTQSSAYLPPSDPGYPRVSNPYTLWSVPFIDQNMSFSSLTGPNGKTGLQYSTLLTSDLMYMNAAMYLNARDSSLLPDARLTLTRSSADADLLGLMRARSVTLGSTYSPDLPLISRSNAGFGFTVSRYPLNMQSQFDTHTFQGDILPNWDVELYRDTVLLDYQQAREDGRYEFRNVSLLFGLNQFRLVFHGPQGEKRVEEQVFYVGESQIKKGEYYYRLSATQDEEGYAHFALQNDIGLMENLSLSASLASVQMQDSTHNYASLGFRGFWKGMFAHNDFVVDQDGGWGNEFGMQTRVGHVSVALNHILLNNFYSDLYQAGGNSLSSHTDLRLDGITVPSFLHLQPISFDLSHDGYKSGQSVFHMTNRVSADLRRYTLSHYLEWEYDDGSLYQSKSNATGTILLNRRLRDISLRGEAGYSIAPVFKLSNLAVSAEALLPNDHSLDIEVLRSLDEHQTSILASYNSRIGEYTAGVTGGYSGQNGICFGVTMGLHVGIGWEPATGEWRTDSKPFASKGAVISHVFLDTNQNGKMDSGEKPLEGVGFAINGSEQEIRTDKNGTAFIPGLPSYQPTDLSISTATLEDPLWMPVPNGVRLTSRPGNVIRIDFPVVVTGEITGTVRIKPVDIAHEAPGVHIELVDANDKIVQSVTSAYDGFYIMSKVPVGKYKLRVSPEQAARAKLFAPSHDVEILPAGSMVDGIDITLEPLDTSITK